MQSSFRHLSRAGTRLDVVSSSYGGKLAISRWRNLMSLWRPSLWARYVRFRRAPCVRIKRKINWLGNMNRPLLWNRFVSRAMSRLLSFAADKKNVYQLLEERKQFGSCAAVLAKITSKAVGRTINAATDTRRLNLDNLRSIRADLVQNGGSGFYVSDREARVGQGSRARRYRGPNRCRWPDRANEQTSATQKWVRGRSAASRKIRSSKPLRYATARYQSCAVEHTSWLGARAWRGRRPPHPYSLRSPRPTAEKEALIKRERDRHCTPTPLERGTGPASPVLPLDAAPSSHQTHATPPPYRGAVLNDSPRPASASFCTRCTGCHDSGSLFFSLFSVVRNLALSFDFSLKLLSWRFESVAIECGYARFSRRRSLPHRMARKRQAIHPRSRNITVVPVLYALAVRSGLESEEYAWIAAKVSRFH